jgi:hypothetical protein
VSPHIAADTLAEGLGPDPAFEHPEQGLTFEIRELIEGLMEIGVRRDRLTDGAGGQSGIGVRGMGGAGQFQDRHLELGMDFVGRLAA